LLPLKDGTQEGKSHQTGVIVSRLSACDRIASIDFHPPYIVSGSSDKHVRVFNLQTREGWSTCCETTHTIQPELPDNLPASLTSGANPSLIAPARAPLPLHTGIASSQVCQSCNGLGTIGKQRVGHKDLVRTVAMNHDFVVSGSYDETIKVWDRQTGALLGDLTGGHTGRVFGVVFDSTKVSVVIFGMCFPPDFNCFSRLCRAARIRFVGLCLWYGVSLTFVFRKSVFGT
jgi:WD40 repeat protein